MKGDKTGVTRRLWLFMLEHGGRWSVSELAEQMNHETAYIDRILWSMHDVGSVSKGRSGQRKNGIAFWVTPKNRLPQSLTLGEVQRALGVRIAIERNEAAANDSKRKAA
jgi:hypothetical protein